MKLALDTNILAYAEGGNGTERRERALFQWGFLRCARTQNPLSYTGRKRKTGRALSHRRSC
ncbi:MAG: hypothetical protein LBV50_01805 [Novosphingobium sp.]|nr:hypothetical protein [Novosphingobium sp.]